MPYKDKEKRSVYNKMYREKNKKKLAENRKEWEKKNRKKLLEYKKLYREKNKEYIAKKYKEWREENKERVKESHTKHYQKDKEKYIERVAKRKRELGFNPLNKKFSGSVGHHINTNDVVYIPEELHKSIIHKQGDIKSMNEINKLVTDWYNKQEGLSLCLL